jgi:sec-independent protein translocase protein TatB
MFNVGGGEVLMILLLALMVLGPQKLPDAARRVGNIMGELRRMSSGFQSELRAAMDEPDRPLATRSPSPVTEAEDMRPNGKASTPGAPARPRRTQPLRAAPRPKRPSS